MSSPSELVCQRNAPADADPIDATVASEVMRIRSSRRATPASRCPGAASLGEGKAGAAKGALVGVDLTEARLGEERPDLVDGAEHVHAGGKRGKGLLVAGSVHQEQPAAGAQHAANIREVGQRLAPEHDG